MYDPRCMASELTARPPRFSYKAADLVVQILHTGASLDVAAQNAGVAPETVRAWMAMRKSFRQRVEMAQSGVEVLAVGTIRQAFPEDWKAAAYLLDRSRAEAELARLRDLTTDHE